MGPKIILVVFLILALSSGAVFTEQDQLQVAQTIEEKPKIDERRGGFLFVGPRPRPRPRRPIYMRNAGLV